MIAWMKDGRREFKDLLYEAVRLINLSVKQCGKWDIEDIDEPLRGKLRKETVFIRSTIWWKKRRFGREPSATAYAADAPYHRITLIRTAEGASNPGSST